MAIITEAMVKSYTSNVVHLAQQKGSRLRGKGIRIESQKAERAYYDRLGEGELQEIVGRSSDTQYVDPDYSRRAVDMRPFARSVLCDSTDKLKVIHQPTSEYAKTNAMAAGRKIDDIIIAAALGSAYGDKEGNTAIPLPNSQKLACFDGTTTTGVEMNIETLIRLRGKFWENESDDEPIYLVVTGRQLEDLLNEEKLTSSDYASVKALVRGEINSFMGFEFIRSQRLPRLAANATYTVTNGTVGAGTGTVTAATSRRCFSYQGSAILLAIGEDSFSRIQEESTKNYSWSVYFRMVMGATRLEEERVVELICNEA
jgi:hypothetical protein